jgi:predicted nucleotidyltransferase
MARIPNEIISAVKKFKEDIKTDLSVKKVFVFGSYAKGIFNEDSDIDVCIIAENVENNFLAELKIAPKVLYSDVRIEPVVFSEEEFLEVDSFGVLREVKENGVEVV